MQTVLLFSGGVDSFVAYHYLQKEMGIPESWIIPVYFDLGTKYANKEMTVVKELIPHTIIDTSLNLNQREIGEKAYIPFRNLYLTMLAQKYGRNVCLAGLKDDKVDDKNPEAFAMINACLNQIHKPTNNSMSSYLLNLFSPFWQMTKEDIVKWYLDNIVDPNQLHLISTCSCYSEEATRYCGKCPSCFRKWVAFRSNGIEMEFKNSYLMTAYLERARRCYYEVARNEAIIREVTRYRDKK